MAVHGGDLYFNIDAVTKNFDKKLASVKQTLNDVDRICKKTANSLGKDLFGASNSSLGKSLSGISETFAALSKYSKGTSLAGFAGELGTISEAAATAGPVVLAVVEGLKIFIKIAKPFVKAYLTIMQGVVKTTGSIAIQIGKTLLKPLTSMFNSSGSKLGNKYGLLLGAGITAGISYKLNQFIRNLFDEGGQFEQMTQGIQILFADTRASTSQNIAEVNAASNKMRQNALKAYRDTGMDANTYMEQASSYATKIVTELNGDTQAAADVIDMAMKDMADNWHLLGGDFEMIQNAYMGLLRGNYRMFDNLKLGYGQTKGEVERLLRDAEKLTGMEYDINNLSDIFKAIHAIQEATGMTGTTAREALTTWEGATLMLKNAWLNFKSTVGQGLIYLLRPVLAIIGRISDALVSAGMRFMAWAQKITGIKDLVIGKKDKSITSGIGAVGDALDGVSDGANAAKKAVKELKRELMGFDEINKLTGENGTTSGGTGTSGGGGIGDIEDLVDQSWMNRLVESAGEDLVTWYEQKIKEAWENADFTMIGYNVAEKIASALENINWTKIQNTAEKIGKSIATFLNGVIMNGRLWIDVANSFAEAINTIVYAGYEFVTNFYWTGLGEKLALGLNTAIYKIDATKIGQLISERIKGGLDLAIAFINNTDVRQITNKIYDLLYEIDFPSIQEKAGNLGKSIANALNKVFGNTTLWAQVGSTFGNSIASIINYGYNFVTTFNWEQFGESIVTALKNALDKIDGKKLGKTISGLIEGIFTAIRTILEDEELKASLKKTVEDTLNAIDWDTLIDDTFAISNDVSKTLLSIGADIAKYVGTGFVNHLKKEHPILAALFKLTPLGNELNILNSSTAGTLSVGVKTDTKSLNNTWTTIKNWWSGCGNNLDKDPKNVKVKENRTSLNQAWENIKSWWSNKKLNEKESKVKIKIPKWADIKSSWNNLMSHFKEKKVKVGLDLAAKWNNAKAWINQNVVDKVNYVIPKSLKRLGLRFPYLAQGGFVKANTPQLAVIGDNKREGEIVAPESKLAAMAAMAAQSSNDETNALLRQLIALVASKDSNVYLDGEAIKNNTVKRINNHTRATGQLEIII